jgi:hypothetical protein
MKMPKNPVNVNYAKRTIFVSRPFAICAANPKSSEYHQLTDIQKAFPEYEIVIRTIKQPQIDRHKGLTYAYMEYYISTHENADERMAEYKEKRLRAECHSMKYGHIKKWFLSTYPQIDDFTPEDFQRDISA